MIGGHRTREGMLIEGAQGWGEFSPDPGSPDHVTARWLTAAIEAGTVGWPDPVRGRVPVAVTVPAVEPARAFEIAAASGCAAADVQVATHPDSRADDIARVAAVRDALGPQGRVRADAGGRWDADTAVTAIGALEKAAGGLDYVEQPCRTLDEMAAVRRRVEVRIAADESIRHAAEPIRVAVREAADIAVLQSGALGGVRRGLRIAEVSGLPCVVSATVQTSVGLAAGVALAGALPDLPFACALDTRLSLSADVVADARSLVPVDGYLPVAPMPPAPDPVRLDAFALTDQDRIDRWRALLERAATA